MARCYDTVFHLYDIGTPSISPSEERFSARGNIFRFRPGVEYYIDERLLLPGKASPMHRHEFLEVVIVVSGGLLHMTTDGETVLGPGSVVFLNASGEHRFAARRTAARIVTLCFLPSLLGYNDRVLAESNLIDLHTLLSPFVGEHKAHRAQLTPSTMKKVLCAAYLAIERMRGATDEIGKHAFTLAVKLLLEAVRTDRPGRNALVIDVIASVQGHYRERISQKALAAQFGISPSRLSTEFNRITGTTIGGYINRLRIEDAKRLLCETALPVNVIAYQIGYESLTHFNDVFREMTRSSPTAYRREHSAQ